MRKPILYLDHGGGYRLYRIATIHQTVHLKLVKFIMCKLCFNKLKKNTEKNLVPERLCFTPKRHLINEKKSNHDQS